MDADGLCNAYVVVTCAGHAGHTRNDHSIVPSCDPQWYETVTIELPLPQPVPLNTEILVRVYDKDSEEEGLEVGGDQLVGKCTLPLLKVPCRKTCWAPAAVCSSRPNARTSRVTAGLTAR